MPSRTRFALGEEVLFQARGGRKMPATITSPKISRGKIEIQVAGDPYPVAVFAIQLHRKAREGTNMATSTSIDVRKLSKRAKILGIRGYQKMSPKELRAAVKREDDSFEDIAAPRKKKAKPAKAKPKASSAKPKVKAKKAVKRKAVNGTKAKTKPAAKAKVAKAGDPANPFRHGSNAWKMGEELIKGGKRSDMIKRLKKTMPIHPWSKEEEEDLDFAIRKRILLTAGTMRKEHGFKEKREGRGDSGTIKMIPPGAKSSKKKASTSKTSTARKATKKSAGQKRSSKASSKAKTTSKAKKKVKR